MIFRCMQMKEVLINVDLSVLILNHDMVLVLRTGTKINKEGKFVVKVFHVLFNLQYSLPVYKNFMITLLLV